MSEQVVWHAYRFKCLYDLSIHGTWYFKRAWTCASKAFLFRCMALQESSKEQQEPWNLFLAGAYPGLSSNVF